MKSFYKYGLILALASTPALAEETKEEAIDMSDPTAVYSALGVQAGTNGMQVMGQFGYSPQDGRKHMGVVEYRNDEGLNNYRVRYFTPGDTGLGLFVDASRNESEVGDKDVAVNTATAGLMQVLPVTEKLKLYPSLLVGSIWSDDEVMGQDVYETTTIATFNTYVSYDISDKVWLMVNPAYTYGFDGEETRDFYLEMALGYRISGTETARIHANDDNEMWFSYTQAF